MGAGHVGTATGTGTRTPRPRPRHQTRTRCTGSGITARSSASSAAASGCGAPRAVPHPGRPDAPGFRPRRRRHRVEARGGPHQRVPGTPQGAALPVEAWRGGFFRAKGARVRGVRLASATGRRRGLLRSLARSGNVVSQAVCPDIVCHREDDGGGGTADGDARIRSGVWAGDAGVPELARRRGRTLNPTH